MKHEYQIIDGKPHFGIFFGSYIIIDLLKDNNDILIYKEKLQKNIDAILSNDPSFQARHIDYILRPPYVVTDCFTFNQSVSVKFMIWGRAYKVMRLSINPIKRYKKRRRNGKLKRARIDKRRRMTNGTRS